MIRNFFSHIFDSFAQIFSLASLQECIYPAQLLSEMINSRSALISSDVSLSVLKVATIEYEDPNKKQLNNARSVTRWPFKFDGRKKRNGDFKEPFRVFLGPS